MHQYQEALLKNTQRGDQITVNLQIYNSTAQQDRQQFLKALQELANEKKIKIDEQTRILSFKLPGTTTIANIKQDLEKYCNQKIILMCESMVPNPLDAIGDIKCTTLFNFILKIYLIYYFSYHSIQIEFFIKNTNPIVLLKNKRFIYNCVHKQLQDDDQQIIILQIYNNIFLFHFQMNAPYLLQYPISISPFSFIKVVKLSFILNFNCQDQYLNNYHNLVSSFIS